MKSNAHVVLADVMLDMKLRNIIILEIIPHHIRHTSLPLKHVQQTLEVWTFMYWTVLLKYMTSSQTNTR